VAFCVTQELFKKSYAKNMNQTVPSPVKETVGATKKCPQCQKDVDARATKCPYCQSDIRSWIRKHPIGLLLIALFVVPIVLSQINAKPEVVISPTEQIANMKKSSIESFARSYVKGTLKAPSTAKFSYSPSVKADPENLNSYEVLSHVDSENSYGAMIRSTWSLKAHYVGPDTQEGIDDGTNWKIDEFYFDGEKIKQS
jgi:hypothetical protein